MNKENYHTELSYYALFLLSYLKENHPNLADDETFIKERADYAAEMYEQARLEGYPTEGAQEKAMASLTKGLHFSKYNTVTEVLLNEFADKIPPEKTVDFAKILQPKLEDVFARYQLSDDFASTPKYELLYTELTGAVAINLESNGI